jgi:predicted PurR-regulated permease PerM
MSNYPTPWQKKTMWAALTALFVVFLVVIAGATIWAGANIISFLQPILIPVAIAAILAYLLDPLVSRMTREGHLQRTSAIALIFLIVFFALAGLVWWLVPTISMQSANFAKELPTYTQNARDRVVDLIVKYNRTFGESTGGHGRSKSFTSSVVDLFLGTPAPRSTATPASHRARSGGATETIAPAPSSKITSAERQRVQADVEKFITYLEQQLPAWSDKLWNILKKSIGGFLGVTGFLLSLIMVPIYLFFFLKERPRIEQRWKHYLPLRASPLKDEVAAALSQINNYIIAYFRGQLLVCLVDGTLIGSALTLLGLNFAPLIGVLVVILTMIPYIGIIICWVPAVVIAAFQYGDWTHPLIVTGIFIVIQNLEGMFYAPRIVGNSVGLHPMTVIVSIFVWGLLIGGLLGPILAVPITATIKVLLTRYVWNRRARDQTVEVSEEAPLVDEPRRTVEV